MPPLLSAALLGVVQGLTEFLPVSSSAHLIRARAFFGWDNRAFGLAFAIRFFMRHLGTHSLAVFAWYRLALAAAVLAWAMGR